MRGDSPFACRPAGDAAWIDLHLAGDPCPCATGVAQDVLKQRGAPHESNNTYQKPVNQGINGMKTCQVRACGPTSLPRVIARIPEHFFTKKDILIKFYNAVTSGSFA